MYRWLQGQAMIVGSASILALAACSAMGGSGRGSISSTALAAPASGAMPRSLAATIDAMPKYLPRAKGPGLAESAAAAQAAVSACTAKNARVSVLVADSAGETIVLLSGDGAGVRSQLIARTKIAIVTRYKVPSGEVELRAKENPRLVEEARNDPNIGVLRGGGFPVIRSNEIIGSIAVSGASLTGPLGLDEECARAGLAVLSAH